MALFKVFENSKELISLNLEEGHEYTIGRSEECDFTLPQHKGISRKHIRVFQHEGEWTAELLSKYGAIIADGEAVDAIILEPGGTFQIPPFSFQYDEDLAKKSEKESESFENSPQHQLQTIDENSEEDPSFSEKDNSPNDMEIGELEEHDLTAMVSTNVGNDDLIAYLKISYSGEAEEIIRLDGNHWVGGRDQNCEIFLNDGFISRNHFEITKTTTDYYIRSLKSLNNTTVNGEPLAADTDLQLTSGDIIEIQSIQVIFEIHDESFQDQLVGIDSSDDWKNQFNSPVHVNEQANLPYYGNFTDNGGVEQLKTYHGAQHSHFKRKKISTNTIRAIIAVLGLVLIIGILTSNKKEQISLASKQGGSKLSPEDQLLIKDAYSLARKHFFEHRYSLCLEQIGTIHRKVPFYEDSKGLAKLCTNAFELETIRRNSADQERKRKHNEALINDMTHRCQQQITNSTTVAQLKNCLSEAIEIDPLHPKITRLLDQVEQRDLVRKNRREIEAAKQVRIRAGKRLYQAAKNAFNANRWREAIGKYNNYLRSSYPDPGKLKTTARRELASAKTNFDRLSAGHFKKCRSQFEATNYKSAVASCNAVLKIVPSNIEAQETRDQSILLLEKKLRGIYENAVLEESYGETGAATKKWKKIMEEDIKGGKFYIRAKNKLKNVGAGI